MATPKRLLPSDLPTKKPKKLGDPKAIIETLYQEGVIGMWADREDIGDSSEFARKLREQAQNRHLFEK